MLVFLLVGAILALDLITYFFGADSRPKIGDDHSRLTWS
jgi:hypothetical protein